MNYLINESLIDTIRNGGYNGLKGTSSGSVEKPKPTPAPTPSAGTVKVGDKVKLSANATVYQGNSKGVAIPDWVKGKTYTVQQVGNGTLLLAEISSWVLASECGVSASGSAAKKPSTGCKVKLSANATVYQGNSKGVAIPDWVKGKTYTVQQVGSGTLLLEEISSWVLASECVVL